MTSSIPRFTGTTAGGVLVTQPPGDVIVDHWRWVPRSNLQLRTRVLNIGESHLRWNRGFVLQDEKFRCIFICVYLKILAICQFFWFRTLCPRRDSQRVWTTILLQLELTSTKLEETRLEPAHRVRNLVTIALYPCDSMWIWNFSKLTSCMTIQGWVQISVMGAEIWSIFSKNDEMCMKKGTKHEAKCLITSTKFAILLITYWKLKKARFVRAPCKML